MKSSRLGCISGTGIAITLLTLLIIGGVAYARGGVLFNPGDLNAQLGAQARGEVLSHADTGGRCSACHTAIWENEKMADRCLACHTDLLNSQDNLHTVMLAQSQTTECFICHTDHRGAEAPVTILDLEHFPHEATGYSLQGHRRTAVGASFTCADCHGDRIQAIDLEVCAACHQDIDAPFMAGHLSAFGGECLACHDGIDTYGRSFDHNQAAFQLLGQHSTAACADCHSGARTVPDLQNTPRECLDCHASDDPHSGQFGKDCGGCHTPDGWEEAAFDHSLAAFPLTGIHAEVACSDCHTGGIFKGTPQDCFSCHAVDDAHAGQFGKKCAECHTPDEWTNVKFDHSLAAFPLTGAHSSVPCTDCHKDGVFQGTPQECSACHAEPAYHLGLFGSDCATCHDSAAWTPARFDRPHSFPINHGESGMSACRACHTDSLVSYTCYGCHAHEPGEIERKHREEGISNFQDCTRCHPTGLKEEGGESGEGGGDD